MMIVLHGLYVQFIRKAVYLLLSSAATDGGTRAVGARMRHLTEEEVNMLTE